MLIPLEEGSVPEAGSFDTESLATRTGADLQRCEGAIV
jgi:hypothetical protein